MASEAPNSLPLHHINSSPSDNAINNNSSTASLGVLRASVKFVSDGPITDPGQSGKVITTNSTMFCALIFDELSHFGVTVFMCVVIFGKKKT